MLIKKVIVLFLTLCTSTMLTALIGRCYAIGRNPQSSSPYNYQERYFVECYCDCDDTLHHCPKCEHYHEPKEEQIIVTAIAPKRHTSLTPPSTWKKAFAFLSKKITTNLVK